MPHFWRLVVASLAFVITGLLAPHTEAATRELAADLDRDGVHDRVSVEDREPTRIHVWLSTLGTTRVLTTRRPVLAIAAVDLDGDRRAELIVSDRRSLHVWTTRGAQLHRLRKGHSRSVTTLFESSRRFRPADAPPPPAQDDGAAPSIGFDGGCPDHATLASGRQLILSTPAPRAAALIAPSTPRPPPTVSL